MTTYKEVKGTNVESVASDPSNPNTGQVWFNTAANVLKGQINFGAGSWSSANNMNTGRPNTAGAGIQTAALCFGGYSGSK